MTTPVLGKDIDSWCTKCKMMLGHTVETIVEGKAKRVHCNTCNAQHVYRPNAPGTKTAATRKRVSTSKSGSTKTSSYEELMRGRDASAARVYTIAEKFKPGNLLRHPVFGPGVVTADKGDGKIEVVFAESMRVLVHGR